VVEQVQSVAIISPQQHQKELQQVLVMAVLELQVLLLALL
jgi:hypothetical protein